MIFSMPGTQAGKTLIFITSEMIALLGPQPKEMIQSSEYAEELFDARGTSSKILYLPSFTNRETRQLEGSSSDPFINAGAGAARRKSAPMSGTQQNPFLEFMRNILRWRPEWKRESQHIVGSLVKIAVTLYLLQLP